MSKLNRETHFFKTARTVDSINQTVVLLWFVYPVVGSARAEKKGADITSRTISHHRMPAPFCSVPFSHLHVNEYFSEEQSAMPMLTVMRSDNDKNV